MSRAQSGDAKAGSVDDVSTALALIVGASRVSNKSVDLKSVATDMWPLHLLRQRQHESAPTGRYVVWPESVEEVQAIVRYAAKRQIPLVPYGAGSGVVGGAVAQPGGITIDFKRMRRVVSIDPKTLVVQAESGIIGIHLENHLRRQGYTLGHFPSSIICSTLGGWLAGRSAGQFSSRYGKIEDIVLSLRAVDGAGELHTLGADAWPQAGADPLQLMVGSEGTLGFVCDARLRLWPKPRAEHYWGFEVAGVDHGLTVMESLLRRGFSPSVMRLYDEFDSLVAKNKGDKRNTKKSKPRFGTEVMKVLKQRSLAVGLLNPSAMNFTIDKLPEKCSLILGCEGDEKLSQAQMEAMRVAAVSLGAKDLGAGPGLAWYHGRYHVSYKQSPLFLSGAYVDTMEVSAPWSRVSEIYQAVCKALADKVFVMAHFSHAYLDGCALYFTFAGMNTTDEVAHYLATWQTALETVTAHGGSVSHHHGIGQSRAAFLNTHHGLLWSEFATLKKTYDPHDIVNPGRWS